MKYKIGFLFGRIMHDNWCWSCTVIPTLRVERNKYSFIETGVHGDWWALYINFLFWNFGIKIYQDY